MSPRGCAIHSLANEALIHLALFISHQKGFLMRLVKSTCCSLFLACAAMSVSGCGEAADPAAGIPAEKLAPAAENLGDNPDYAKQFGGAKK